MFRLSIADLRLTGLHFLRVWNRTYLLHLCSSPALLFVSKKGKAIQLNTKEVPCEAKLRNEATVQGTPRTQPSCQWFGAELELRGAVSAAHSAGRPPYRLLGAQTRAAHTKCTCSSQSLEVGGV